MIVLRLLSKLNKKVNEQARKNSNYFKKTMFSFFWKKNWFLIYSFYKIKISLKISKKKRKEKLFIFILFSSWKPPFMNPHLFIITSREINEICLDEKCASKHTIITGRWKRLRCLTCDSIKRLLINCKTKSYRRMKAKNGGKVCCFLCAWGS